MTTPPLNPFYTRVSVTAGVLGYDSAPQRLWGYSLEPNASQVYSFSVGQSLSHLKKGGGAFGITQGPFRIEVTYPENGKVVTRSFLGDNFNVKLSNGPVGDAAGLVTFKVISTGPLPVALMIDVRRSLNPRPMEEYDLFNATLDISSKVSLLSSRPFSTINDAIKLRMIAYINQLL